MTSTFDEPALAGLRKDAEAAVRKRLPAVHAVAHRRLAEAASTMLDLDLTDLITGAWCNTEEIVRAADDSRSNPEPVTVTVGHQEYATTHEAVLEASIDRVPVRPLPVGLDLELEVDSLELTLQGGCLTAIRAGHGALTATLSVDTVKVLPAVRRELDLKKTISLQQPIPLCRPPDAERQRSARPAGSPPSSDLA